MATAADALALATHAERVARETFCPPTLIGLLSALRETLDPGDELAPILVEELGLAVDQRARAAYLEGALLELGQREYELLVTLARDPYAIHTRGDLYAAVWGWPPDLRGRAADTAISRLRRHLRGRAPVNCRGAGWSLLPAPDRRSTENAPTPTL